MRILIAVDFYPPFIGGVERQMQLLARGLVQRGHQVTVATGWAAGLPEQEDDQGVSVHRLKGVWDRIPWFYSDPENRRGHPPCPDPLITRGLGRLIDQVQPEVVQAYCWIAYSCAAALRGTDIPLILLAADFGYSCTTRNLMHHGSICDGPALSKCIECAARTMGWPKALAGVSGVFGFRRMLLRRVAAVACVSDYVEQTILRDLLNRLAERPGYDPKSIQTAWAPPIIDLKDDQEPSQETLEQLPSEPFMLFVGALANHKGVGPLLRAYERLDSPPPLVLMGTRWAETPKSYPKGVTVFHNVPHGTVMAAWQRSLFGLTPSCCAEALGLVVLEAMIAGKAVIGSDVGGIPEMIEQQETGLLVPMGDAEALAAAMQHLLDNPALCDRLGSAGQAWVQQHVLGIDPVKPMIDLYMRLTTASSEA